MIKTEEGPQYLFRKNIFINKKNFLNKINNISPSKSKEKKDILKNKEASKNKKNNNKEPNNKSVNKNIQISTILRVKENKKTFTRTFSGYGLKYDKSSFYNNKNKIKNDSHSKQKKMNDNNINMKNIINNYNQTISNQKHFKNMRNIFSKSEKNQKKRNFISGTFIKEMGTNNDTTKRFVNSCNKIVKKINLSKSNSDFFDSNIKRNFFHDNYFTNSNQHQKKSEIKRNINFNNKNFEEKKSSPNNIINVKVKIINKFMSTKRVNNNYFSHKNNNQILKQISKSHINNPFNKPTFNKTQNNISSSNIKNKISKITSKSQNKISNINLVNEIDDNLITKKNDALRLKNKIKSKDKEKELTIKKAQKINNNDVSFSTQRTNSQKENNLCSSKIIKLIHNPDIKSGYTFGINIISNWGHKRQVSFKDIELYDFQNKKIKINNIIIKDDNRENIHKNSNFKNRNNCDNEIWTFDISKKNNQDLNIYLYIYSNIDSSKPIFDTLNFINIWNYNGFDSNKGIKQIEIFNEDYIFFSGIIPKGTHSRNYEHLYKIEIREGLTVKKGNNNIKDSRQSMKNSSIKNENDTSIECNYISCNRMSTNKKIFNSNQSNQTIFENENIVINKRNPKLSFIKVSYKKRAKSELNILHKNKETSRSCEKDSKSHSYLVKNMDGLNSNNNAKYNTRGINETLPGNINDSFNIKSIKFNRLSPKNICPAFSKEQNNNQNSSELSSTLRFYSLKSNNVPFITINKIRINILTNYGNQLSVGLTGINLIDNNLNQINIKSAKYFLASPKDLRTVYEYENDHRIFENLFNQINNTNCENNMWLTLISHKPYIEIYFDKAINLSKIEIWNFNAPNSLDNGVREIEIIFDDDLQKKKFNIFLWKGLGNNFFNYYQTIKCDYDNLKKLSEKCYEIKNSVSYVNYFTGFIFKLVFISNFGDKDTISLKKVEIFDENGEKMNKFHIIDDVNYSINSRKRVENDLIADNYFYYHEFFDIHKTKDSTCNNILYICFDEIVRIKFFNLINTNDERFKMTSTKEIQIYCDDLLFFEGKLNQIGENVIKLNNGRFINENYKEKDSYIENNLKNYNSYKEYIKGNIYELVLEK